MDWVLWAAALVVQGVPVGALVADRLFDLPARRLLAISGPPALAIFLAIAAYAWATSNPLFTLLWLGVVGGLLATAALDGVRLIGVRLGLFPADMPTIFGVIIRGLAPTLQRNMLAAMVRRTALLDDGGRTEAMRPRVEAMARLSPQRRKVVVTGMVTGLSRLPDAERQAMLQTQMGLLAALPGEDRRRIMSTMDLVMNEQTASGNGLSVVPLPYTQPRGMPKVPMATFRSLFEEALPMAVEEAGTSLSAIRWAGYLWHFAMGIALSAPYFLLFGSGSWALAVAWGIFVWLGMMVLMPPMMPMVRFPWWFPIWPFLAHIAFAIPLGYLGLQLVEHEAAAKSLLGALGVL